MFVFQGEDDTLDDTLVDELEDVEAIDTEAVTSDKIDESASEQPSDGQVRTATQIQNFL